MANFFGIEIKRIPTHEDPQKKTFETYHEASMTCRSSGYEQSQLMDVIFEKTRRYISALESGPISLNTWDSVTLTIVHQLAQSKSSLSILDFGGACGAHYWMVRQLLDKKYTLKWHVVETAAMVEKAKPIRNGELQFFTNVSDALQAFPGKCDLVFASSVLQYTADPWSCLDQLIGCGAEHLAIVRSNVTSKDHDEISVQKSSLSANGIGALPPGFQDAEIFYPLTLMQKKKLDRMVDAAGYKLTLSFPQTIVGKYEFQFGALYSK